MAWTAGKDLIVYDLASGRSSVVAVASQTLIRPDWSPDGSTLVYADDPVGQGVGEIHIVRADGSEDRVVTRGYSAAWSPDGTRLAVKRAFYSPFAAIDVVRTDGSLLAHIATDSGPSAAIWSPDGRELAYETCCDPNALIVAVADGSTDKAVVAPHQGVVVALQWSPDGDHILYAGGSPDRRWGPFAVGSAGEVPRPLLDVPADVRGLSWSPDGRQFAFAAEVDPEAPTDAVRSRIFIADATGTNVHPLTQGRNDTSPSWSPDGSRIVYARDGTLTIVRVSGGGRHLLGPGSAPAWSPRGRTIAFIDWAGSISTIRPDGSGLRRIVSGAEFGHPSWAPDGRTLAATRTSICGNTTCTRVEVVGLDGSKPPRLDLSRASIGVTDVPVEVEWSPDGRSIAVLMSGGRLVLLPIGGGEPSTIAVGVVAPAWQSLCTQTGTAADDVLRGAAGGLVCGREGNDTLLASSGDARLLGGSGNDTILARNGRVNIIGCGPGIDRAVADRSDLVGPDCERTSRG